MSIKTWKEKFYPIPADKLKYKSTIAAVKHSLKKWTGLLPENLKEHDCLVVSGDIYGKNSFKKFDVDCGTCALCIKFADDFCVDCPIKPCDHGSIKPPWQEWHARNDPKPMIRVLEKALKKLEKK